MIKIRVGGVPEHFNLPWHLCREEGLFDELGVEVEWKDFPGGTGAMTRELRHHGLDLAVVLTEGMISDISLGNKSKILSFYTASPLIWGVHTTAYSKFEVVKDVDPPIFAISRWGSGSHLMAYLFAKNQGWNPHTDINFKVVGNLKGARESLAEKTSNLFMWEKFTTKPYVDSEEFKRLSNQATPWPCFVLAGSNAFLSKHDKLAEKVLNTVLKRAQELKQHDSTPALIAERYELKESDVKEWLSITNWQVQSTVDEESIELCVETLEELGILKQAISSDKLVWKNKSRRDKSGRD